MKHLVSLLWAVNLWLFIAIKVAGTSYAAWSWWWLLMPYVPNMSLAVRHYGL
jgi:hypothetical protein